LSDETFYEKVPEDKTQDINDQVYAIVEDEIKKGNLPKEARTLIQRKPRFWQVLFVT
jgi:acyl-CoA hydrolase